MPHAMPGTDRFYSRVDKARNVPIAQCRLRGACVRMARAGREPRRCKAAMASAIKVRNMAAYRYSLNRNIGHNPQPILYSITWHAPC